MFYNYSQCAQCPVFSLVFGKTSLSISHSVLGWPTATNSVSLLLSLCFVSVCVCLTVEVETGVLELEKLPSSCTLFSHQVSSNNQPCQFHSARMWFLLRLSVTAFELLALCYLAFWRTFFFFSPFYSRTCLQLQADQLSLLPAIIHKFKDYKSCML